nr:sugar transferase [Chloroflexota bacterium]
MADVTEEPSLADRPTLTFADAGVPLTTPATLRRASRWPAVLLVGSDAVLILIGFALAYWMRYNVSWPAPFNRIVQEVLTVNYVSFASFLPYALLLT